LNSHLNPVQHDHYQGVLLTRSQYDIGEKCVFEFWVKSDIGVCQLVVEGETPICFVTNDDVDKIMGYANLQKIDVEAKPLSLMTFEKTRCYGLYAKNLKSYYALRRLANSIGIELLEDDIKPIDRYLMERFVKNELVFSGNINRGAPGSCFRVTNCKIKQGRYKPSSSSFVSVDIECDEKGNLFSIGLHQPDLEHGARVLYNVPNGVPIEDFGVQDYIEWHQSEKDILLRFDTLIAEWDPDFVIGWNFIKFDLKVLDEAARRHGITLKLGRNREPLQYNASRTSSEQQYPARAYAAGRVFLDGIDVLKNATYHFDSFSLDFVSESLLNDRKLINEDNGLSKLAEIKRQYKQDPIKLAEYNLQDCMLVSRIFVQESLIKFVFTRSGLTGLELDRVGGSVAAFTNLYLPHAHRKGWIAPNLVKPENYQHSPGGFVMDSKPGLHNDVLVFDFKSLYPSIIRTFNIDPIALLEANEIAEQDVIAGFRGGRFSRDHSILASVLDELWSAREEAKAVNSSVLSNAIKIIMNSFYGVLGSSGCRFYDTKLASSITMRGHWVLNESKHWFESRGLKVIYGDTDSIFVCLDNTSISVGDAKQLEEELNEWWQQKISAEFKIKSLLEMEFETHYSPFFMPTIRGTDAGSKKRYAGLKQLDNGQSELVIKGLESVRSDWTEIAKQFQTRLLQLIFAGEDYIPYITQTISKLRAGELDDLLVYRKRIRQPLDNYRKTTPPQIKAARMANNLYGQDVYKKGSRIAYVIGLSGPEAAELSKTPIDYEYYVQKQIFPIVESLLVNISNDWRTIFERQYSLL